MVVPKPVVPGVLAVAGMTPVVTPGSTRVGTDVSVAPLPKVALVVTVALLARVRLVLAPADHGVVMSGPAVVVMLDPAAAVA